MTVNQAEDPDVARLISIEDQLKAPFMPHQIKWRVGSTKGDSTPALLYIDARDVMDRLDDVVGQSNWETTYTDHDSRCVCVLRIRYQCEDGSRWVSKSDVGTASTFEAEKGMYSDALKRAAVQFGIARYLYGDEVTGNKWFKLDGKRFSKSSEDEIRNLVNNHYRMYANPKAVMLKILLTSATTVKMLKGYLKENADLYKEIKENDEVAAAGLKMAIQKRGNALKRMDQFNG